MNRILMLVAPAKAFLHSFSHVVCSSRLHAELIAEIQRHRGQIYLEDRAIADSDLMDGRHISPLDPVSWHLLTLGTDGMILGCLRLRGYSNRISAEELAVSRCAIARSEKWGERFRASLDRELRSARQAGIAFMEVGGWALHPGVRGTAEALKSVLAGFALIQMLGGALVVSTATRRHQSASILRRLGGEPLAWEGAEIPAYYDPLYGCEMEVIRFDSRSPNPRFEPILRDIYSQIARIPVVCPGEEASQETGRRTDLLQGSFRRVGLTAERPAAVA
jgi:hypothetical protein